MRLRLRTEQAPVLDRVHLRALLRETMGQRLRDLHTVGVTDHVVVKNNTAHPRQLDTTGLQHAPAAFFKPFRAFRDLLADALRTGISKSAIVPMPVRAEHAG